MNIETIFANFIANESIDVDTNSIREFCYQRRMLDPKGCDISNHGGWQSNSFYANDVTGEIRNLIDIINRRLYYMSSYLGYTKNKTLAVDNAWININNKGDHNIWHDHTSSIIVIIYYVSVPENSGNLILRSPIQNYEDFLQADHISSYNSYNSATYTYVPKAGELVMFPSWLMHRVTSNETDEDRISIAFNSYFFDKR